MSMHESTPYNPWLECSCLVENNQLVTRGTPSWRLRQLATLCELAQLPTGTDKPMARRHDSHTWRAGSILCIGIITLYVVYYFNIWCIHGYDDYDVWPWVNIHHHQKLMDEHPKKPTILLIVGMFTRGTGLRPIAIWAWWTYCRARQVIRGGYPVTRQDNNLHNG